VQVDRLEGGAQIVEPVCGAAEDLKVEVQLGARGERDGQSAIGFRPERYLTTRSL